MIGFALFVLLVAQTYSAYTDRIDRLQTYRVFPMQNPFRTSQIKFAIEAPDDTRVYREELWLRLRENPPAT